MTKAQLQAEVERLRIEVALLRSMQAAHICPQPIGPSWPLQGQVYIGDLPPYRVWTNVCAGPAGVAATFVVNAASANPPLVIEMAPAAAGAAAQPLLNTFWVTC